MNIGVSYRELFSFDVGALRACVAGVGPELWDLDDLRQSTFEVHKKTKSVIYVWSQPDDDDYEAVEMHIAEGAELLLHREVWRVAAQIRAHFGGEARVTKLMLAKLSARSAIKAHFDGGNLTRIHRCHLPVITNDRCVFHIDGKPHHFPATAVVEINNQQLHGFTNDSDEDRVHLICDVLATP